MLKTDTPLGAVRGLPLGAAAEIEVANKKTQCNHDFLLVSPRVRFHIKRHCVNKDFNKATLMDCLSLSLSLDPTCIGLTVQSVLLLLFQLFLH